MPGFCGYFGDAGEEKDGRLIETMCRLLVHWGDHRAVRFVTNGLALAVLARSNMKSPLPFVDGESGISALIEGEIYNLDEVLSRLRGRGLMMSGTSLSEVALRAYQAAGTRAGLLLSGAYNIFIWDKARKSLIIMNDRFGLRPLYYTRIGEDFFFASELKAFTALPGLSPSLDQAFLYQFLTFGFPLGEHTLMRGVHLLPLATVLTVRKGSFTLSPYWGPEHWPERSDIACSEAVEGFADHFSRAMERVLRGPEKKGILLSGGIDSRLIAVDAARKGEHLPTFTYGEEGCDDARIAREVAGELELSNTFLPLGPDFLLDASLEVCWLTDGMYNVFHSHGVSAYETIAGSVDVLLTGMEQIALYLDRSGFEELRGSASHARDPHLLFRYLSQEPSYPITGERRSLLEDSSSEWALEEARHARRLIHGGAIVSSSGVLDPLRTIEWMGLRHRQRRFTLMGQLLIRNWLEVRSPFTDSDLVLYAMSLPDALRTEEKPLHTGFLESTTPALLGVIWQKTGQSIKNLGITGHLAAGKGWILRRAGDCLSRIAGTERESRKRKLADYHAWLTRDHLLRRFVRGVLLSPRTGERGIFKREALLDILDEEFSNRAIHTELIGRIISLELSMRLFFEGEKGEGES